MLKRISQPKKKISFWFLSSQSCDPLELQRRYPHLQMPSNLFHLQLSWTESFPPNHPLRVRGPCLFHVGSHQPETAATVSESTGSTFTVRVRVSHLILFLTPRCSWPVMMWFCSLCRFCYFQRHILRTFIHCVVISQRTVRRRRMLFTPQHCLR